MMEIRINGESLDIGDETIVQSFGANDFRNFGERSGQFTNQFKAGLTNHNRELLSFAGQPGVFPNPTTRRISAELWADNIRISTGYIRIDAITDAYELTFFSGLTDLLVLIKGRSLRDLRLANLDHALDEGTIINSFDHTWEDGYTYPLANYGGLTSKNNTNILFSQGWRPAIYVPYLIHEICREAGWKVKGDIFDDPVFSRMLIPSYSMNPSLPTINEDAGVLYNFFNTVPGSDGALLVPDANVGQGIGAENSLGFYNPATGQFTVNNTYSVTVDVFVLINNTGVTTTFTLGAYVNGSLSASVAQGISSPGQAYLLLTTQIALSQGDTLDFRITTLLPTTFFIMGVNISPQGNVFKISPNLTADLNSNWLGWLGLPDIEQSALLKYVVVSFAGMIDTDNENRQLTINLFETISHTRTWAGKLDLSQPVKEDAISLTQGYGQRNWMRYKTGPTDEDEAFEDANGYSFGSGYFTVANELLEPEKDLYEAPFIGAMNSPAFVNVGALAVKPTLPLLADDNSGYILVAQGKIPFGDLAFGSNTYQINGGSSQSDVMYASFVSPVIANQVVNDNAFGLAYTSINSISLLDHWTKVISLLNENRLYEARMNLSNLDIYSLDFTGLVYIPDFEAYFYVNKVEYDGESAVVEMIKT